MSTLAEDASRRRTLLLSRPAPIVGLAALGGSAALVARFDPAAPGSLFPSCVFRTYTGLWCPGCGLTRAAHELMRGNIGTALGLNLFVPVAIVGLALAWWAWWQTASGRAFPGRWITRATGLPGSATRRRSDRALWALFVALIAYGALRNIPVEPFRALAP